VGEGHVRQEAHDHTHEPPRGPVELARRWVALLGWCFCSWLLLSGTTTRDSLLAGLVVAGIVAAALAPLGTVVGPWTLVSPSRIGPQLKLAGRVLAGITTANLDLVRRTWAFPRPDVTPGMVIVPTRARTDAELTAVGTLTSLVVDNQFVDVDRSTHEMLFHCIAVPDGGPEERREEINATVEDDVIAVVRGA
jgi:multicomponent Na+:H+ antiporter subunit E